jgi:hypothetical protein
LAGRTLGRQRLIDIGANITETCYLMYKKQASGLSPEEVLVGTFQAKPGKGYYIQRPEVVESIFLMYRVTKDVKYRYWGLEIAQAIEKHCKVATGGYTSLNDINNIHDGNRKDKQESFFIAETLKYLYLLFCKEDYLSLDEWVFNTEAHPLPILKNGF